MICAKRDFVFLDEVGARLKFSEPFLSEHTYHICDRAVEKMAELK